MTNTVLTKRFTVNQTKEQAFNTDTLLLANYVKVPKRCKNILDIGTGSGVLMLDLAMRTKAKIVGVEIQTKRFKQALDNISINGLSKQLTVYNEDVKTFDNKTLYDLIITNPPFFKVNNKKQLSEKTESMIARHEVELKLEDLLKSVSRLLKYRGYFYMIHRPERLDEIINYCKKYNLAVKEIRFVHPYINSDANHILIKAIKNSNQGIIINAPLIIYKEKEILTNEMKKIIGGF